MFRMGFAKSPAPLEHTKVKETRGRVVFYSHIIASTFLPFHFKFQTPLPIVLKNKGIHAISQKLIETNPILNILPIDVR